MRPNIGLQGDLRVIVGAAEEIPPMQDDLDASVASIGLASRSTPSIVESNILPSGDSLILLAPPDATMPTDLGKIEYRHDPPFWMEAVSARLLA